MTVYLFLPLLAFGINAALCLAVLWGHASKPAHRVFTLFLASMAVWGGTIFLMRSSSTAEASFIWDKLALVNFSLIAVFFLHFTYLFAGNRVPRKIIVGGYAIIPIVAVLAFTNMVAEGMQTKVYGYAPIPGLLFPLYLVLAYSCMFLALWNLISAYRRPTSQAQRNQAGYLITASAFFLLGGANDILPLLGLTVYPLGMVGNILFAILASVAITRHRLLDIQVALRRSIGFLLVIILMAGVYVLASLGVQQAFDSNILTASFTIGVGIIVLGYLVFSPLLGRVQDAIDRAFLRQRWAPLQELLQFTTETNNITDLSALAFSLLKLVQRAMDTEVVVLLQANRSYDLPWTAVAVGTDALIPPHLNGRNPWLQRLAKEDRAYSAEEMFALPEWQSAPFMVRAQIEGLEIKVFLPLRYNGELTGLLLLGAKSTQRDYSLEELDLLEAVALHAAATMENAQLYEELRLQLRELKETQAQLVQSGKLASVGTLAAGVAHEVNNPLFAISGMTELLLSNPERHLKSEQAEEYVTIIAEMSQRIAKVAQGMLAFSRNDQVMSPVCLNDVADDTLSLMEHKLRSGGINVVREYQPDLPHIQAVANQLEQALMNLIMNAADAMGESGTLTLGTGFSDNQVWISCTDTGTGIAAEDMDKIFDAFFTTRPVGKGTGLGLHITHQIVENLNGEIMVNSEEGMGTTFTIALPLTPADNSDPNSMATLSSAPEQRILTQHQSHVSAHSSPKPS